MLIYYIGECLLNGVTTGKSGQKETERKSYFKKKKKKTVQYLVAKKVGAHSHSHMDVCMWIEFPVAADYHNLTCISRTF